MKRITTLLAIFGASTGCMPSSTPPAPKPAAAKWAAATEAAGPPTMRDEAIAVGFPHELPEAPRALENPQVTPWTSGRAIAFHDDDLYVVDTENGKLVVLDRDGEQAVKREIAIGSRPEQVVVAPDGTAYVTVRHGSRVAKIAPGAASVTDTIVVGVEPIGLALNPDASTLYVAVAGAGALVAIDVISFSEVARTNGLDRPRHVAVGSEGEILVSPRGDRLARFEHDGEELILDTQFEGELRRSQPADNNLHPERASRVKANRVRGIVIQPENGNILVAHHQSITGGKPDVFSLAFELVEDQIGEEFGKIGGGEGYGGHGIFSPTPHIVKPIETTVTGFGGGGAGGPLNNSRSGHHVKDGMTLEPLVHLVAQPSDINHHPTWSLAFVTGFGSDNVLVLNTAVDDPMRSPLAIIDVGMAPKAITFSDDGTYAYVLNAHSFTVSEVDLSPFFAMAPTETSHVEDDPQATDAMGGSSDSDGMAAEPMMMPHAPNTLQVPVNPDAVHTAPIRLTHAREAQFGTDPLPEEARLGRRIFTYVYNNNLSHGFQFACHSCHLEGGEDGLLWPAAGGLKQTPQLAGRLADTGPFNWLGTEDSLQDNMEKTIERMQGDGLDGEELVSLERFMIDGMVRPPNPHLDPAGLTPAQLRGKNLFEDTQVGCAVCHSGTAYTDGKFYDVGTMNDMEHEVLDIAQGFSEEFQEQGVTLPETFKYNTPSLLDLFATAPYLHDGSAPTLMDVLDKTATTMGHTAHLSQAEKQDLVAYLLTL